MGAQLTSQVLPRHLEEIKDLTKHGHSFLLVIEVHRVRQLLKLERHNRHKLQTNNAMVAAWKKSPLLWACLLLHKICGPPLSARSRVPEVGSLSTTTTAYHVLVEENTYQSDASSDTKSVETARVRGPQFLKLLRTLLSSDSSDSRKWKVTSLTLWRCIITQRSLAGQLG